MNFCFDIDGPIIDVSDRYYRAYLESLRGYDITKEQILTKDYFWKLKQNRVSELEIGVMSGLSSKEAKAAADLRKELNFKQDYLSLDKLFDDVIKTFEFLKSHNITFFVVTLRTKKELEIAIKQFKLNKLLPENRLFPLQDEIKIQSDIQNKYSQIYNAINRLALNPLDTWMVGDSETDIHAAKLARCGKVVAISRGIRSKEQLDILKPNFVVSNLSELLSLASNNQ